MSDNAYKMEQSTSEVELPTLAEQPLSVGEGESFVIQVRYEGAGVCTVPVEINVDSISYDEDKGPSVNLTFIQDGMSFPETLGKGPVILGGGDQDEATEYPVSLCNIEEIDWKNKTVIFKKAA